MPFLVRYNPIPVLLSAKEVIFGKKMVGRIILYHMALGFSLFYVLVIFDFGITFLSIFLFLIMKGFKVLLVQLKGLKLVLNAVYLASISTCANPLTILDL